MRINFVLPRFYSGPIGGYRIVYQHANALAERGHDVTVVLPRFLGKTQLGVIGWLKARVWPMIVAIRHRPLVDWQAIHPKVKLLLVGNLTPYSVPRGDVVIATAWQTAEAVAQLAGSKGRKYYLVQDYETWCDVDPARVDATFTLPFHVLAISKWLLQLTQEKGAKKVTHIPNAIDHNLFRVLGPEPLLRPPAILALYHESPRKNTRLAIEALTAVHALHPKINVTMFGIGSRPPEIPDWINYHEKPIGEELASLYNAHSIYLSASLKEGWALPPAEAMACGCAFVGTDSAGPRDYVDEGETALLSKSGELQPLVTNLLKVIEDDELRHKLQALGQRKIVEFTWKRSGEMMEQALAP